MVHMIYEIKMIKSMLLIALVLLLAQSSSAFEYRYITAYPGELVNFSTEQYDLGGVYDICLYNVSGFPTWSSSDSNSLDSLESLPINCDSPPAYAFLMTDIHDNSQCLSIADTNCDWSILHDCVPPICDVVQTFADCSFDPGTGVVPCACPIDCETDASPICDCLEYSILTSKNEFPASFSGMYYHYYYCGSVVHGAPANQWNWTGDNITQGCFIVNLTKPSCPNNAIPAEGDVCYSPDYYNWGACSGSQFSSQGINECLGPAGDARCAADEGAGSLCYCLPLINLTLDIGRIEELREWENSTYYFEKERVWNDPKKQEVLDRINTILKSECGGSVCPGCVDDGTNCEIPFHFLINIPNGTFVSEDIIAGNLTVNDILFEYYYYNVINSVPYNKTYVFSEGANWTFGYDTSGGPLTSPTTPVPPDCGATCESQNYQTPTCPEPSPLEDAADDAMYRLLRKLDTYDDGAVDCYIDLVNVTTGTAYDPSTMFFDVEERLKAPIYWGPIPVKLVVWI